MGSGASTRGYRTEDLKKDPSALDKVSRAPGNQSKQMEYSFQCTMWFLKQCASNAAAAIPAEKKAACTKLAMDMALMVVGSAGVVALGAGAVAVGAAVVGALIFVDSIGKETQIDQFKDAVKECLMAYTERQAASQFNQAFETLHVEIPLMPERSGQIEAVNKACEVLKVIVHDLESHLQGQAEFKHEHACAYLVYQSALNLWVVAKYLQIELGSHMAISNVPELIGMHVGQFKELAKRYLDFRLSQCKDEQEVPYVALDRENPSYNPSYETMKEITTYAVVDHFAKVRIVMKGCSSHRGRYRELLESDAFACPKAWESISSKA